MPQHTRAPQPAPPSRCATAVVQIAGDIIAALGAPPPLDPAAVDQAAPLADRHTSCSPLGSVVRLGDSTPEPLHWLSPGRLALGKATVLDGDPGLGKSTLLTEFAARIARGQPLPGG